MESYKHYRWFKTSHDLVVIGGKSAEQNDTLLKGLYKKGPYIVMHTAEPGSPFAVLLAV